jgi:hypothetical protein
MWDLVYAVGFSASSAAVSRPSHVVLKRKNPSTS